MSEDVCDNTGLDIEECPCMTCRPPMFFFKNLVAAYECRNINDVISALKNRLAYFKKMKADGFRLSGPVTDHWAEFEPPESEEFYWVECASGGCYVKFPSGMIPPAECPECGKNLYEYGGPEKKGEEMEHS